ncbi:MAG: DUF5320 domain-containing protein [Candidatus Bipolaricaulis sp.]|nr:DUF5320 domain-containing protein [Candidatus Bipolaricaulis sp.]MDD5646582.1 DUF5320 domain-containing protein [Candidatus Bipolaricaulis sp.]
MPGFDGTGPRGMGPMTGGARGYCVVPGGAAPIGWGRQVGRAVGAFGRGFGGRGLRRGLGFGAWGAAYAAPLGAPYGSPYGSETPAEQDLAWLQQEAKNMEGELERIRARIQQLES